MANSQHYTCRGCHETAVLEGAYYDIAEDPCPSCDLKTNIRWFEHGPGESDYEATYWFLPDGVV